MEEPLLHPLIFVERCKYTKKNVYPQAFSKLICLLQLF